MELTLLKDLGKIYPNINSKKKYHFGLYKCHCGNEFKARISHIKYNSIKSCGCLRIKLNTTHGMTNTRIYRTWYDFRNRCNNKNNKQYKDYGGRGIKVCTDWNNDFVSFYDWAMKNGYSNNLTIDRINNDGNYEPSNCRWTTQIVQSRNTRVLMTTNKTGYRGVSYKKDRKKYVAQIVLNRKVILLLASEDALECAKEYDKYIIDNNLEHTINGVYGV